MAGLSATGLGSGLDIESLVTKLMAAERAPQQSVITAQRTKATTLVSAFGSLKSTLSGFRDALATLQSGAAFNQRTATSSDSTIFSATGGAGAVSGSYSIEVLQLALAHKTASTPVASSSSAIGTGTLTLSVGAETLNLNVGAANNTLAGIRDAINQSVDNPGVSATIVNASDGARLVLTSTQTGVANTVTVSSTSGSAGLDAFVAGFGTVVPARDAIVEIDGFSVTSAGNKISGAIDGVTLDLLSASPGDLQTLDIGLDRAGITTSLKALVDTYNQFLATSKQLSSYDPTTQKKGALLGDSTLRSIADGLTRALGAAYTGTGGEFESLSSLGISFQVDGKLALDQGRLDVAFDAGIDQVARLFTSPNGLASALDTKFDAWLDSGGLFETRTTTLSERTRDLDTRQLQLDARMSSVEARYRAQFTALDSLLANLNSTSTFLTQQLDTLNISSD